MNFDSIEGLDIDEVNALYEDITEDEYLATTHFQCACKANRVDLGSHLYHAPTENGFCFKTNDNTLVFSGAACQSKCDEMQGGPHQALFQTFNFDPSACRSSARFCGITTTPQFITHGYAWTIVYCCGFDGSRFGYDGSYAGSLVQKCHGGVEIYSTTYGKVEGHVYWDMCSYDIGNYYRGYASLGSRPQFTAQYSTYGACYYLKQR